MRAMKKNGRGLQSFPPPKSLAESIGVGVGGGVVAGGAVAIYFALTINVVGASSGCAALRNKTATGPGENPRPRGAPGPVIQPPLRAGPQSPEEPSARPHPPLGSYRKHGVYKTKGRGRSVSDNKTAIITQNMTVTWSKLPY